MRGAKGPLFRGVAGDRPGRHARGRLPLHTAELHADPAVKSIPWVQPVLVALFAYVGFVAKRSNLRVMDERELLAHASEAGRGLRLADVDGCVTVLQRLTGWQAVQPKDGTRSFGSGPVPETTSS